MGGPLTGGPIGAPITAGGGAPSPGVVVLSGPDSLLPLLTATTHSLEVETGAAISTDYHASYVDYSGSSLSWGSAQGNIAAATTTTIVSAPGSGVSRVITWLCLVNRHASTDQTIIIKKDVSGTEYHVTPSTVTLEAGDSFEWGAKPPRLLVSGQAARRVNPVMGYGRPAIEMPDAATASALSRSSNFSITNNSVYVSLVGYAPKRYVAGSDIGFAFVLQSNMPALTWGEIALYVMRPNIPFAPQNVNRNLVCVGYLDAWNGGTGVFSGAGPGARSGTVTIASGQVIEEGEAVWMGFAQNGAGNLFVSGSSADMFSGGFAMQATSASLQPSLNVGLGNTGMTLWSPSTTHTLLAVRW